MTNQTEPAPQGQPRSRNTLLFVGLLVGTLVLSAGAAILALRPSGVAPTNAVAALADCSGFNAATCVGDAALALADDEGAAAGLDAVRMLLESRADIRQGCHSVAHEVGNRFYERFNDDAIVPGHTWCSWGYYHGLMQAHTQSNLDGLVEYATMLCTKVDGTPTVDCMHGVGHAAYANLRDIGPAMTTCEGLTGEYAATCADAIIMEELFLSPDGRLTSGFNPDDCLEFANPDVVAGCGRGLTSDMIQRGADLTTACSVFTGSAARSCADGYGAALAGNELSGSSALLNSAMFATCAADTTCAGGYGWIAYMYLVDFGRAEAACQRNFTGAGLKDCITSARLASEREVLK